MPTTATYLLPYPANADPADVPLDMQELCARLEVVLATLVPKAACSVARTTTQATTNAVEAAISFVTEHVDTASMWAAGAPDRVIIPAAGVYRVTGDLRWALNGTGARVALLRNAAGAELWRGEATPNATSATTTIAQMTRSFAAADYLRLIAFQSSGGALDVAAASLEVERIA